MTNEVTKPRIYINPSFNLPPKNKIHINPNVQLNVAIHVNPKMVNTLSASHLTQLNQQKIYNQQTQSIGKNHAQSFTKFSSVPNVASDNFNSKLNTQKSVYVNPKLMHQFKSVPVVQKSPVTPITPISPVTSKFISKRTLVSKNKIINNNTVNYNNRNVFVNNGNKRTFINTNNKSLNNSDKTWTRPKSINTPNTKILINKKISPSLVSISKRKLVRIRPATKLSLNNSPVLKKSPVLSKKSPVKLHNLERIKKSILCSPVSKFKLNNLESGKISPSTKGLKVNLNKYKKINVRPVASTSLKVRSTPGSSTGNKYKIDRTKAEKKKIVGKSRVVRGKRSTSTNLIKIDGVMYKSSKSQLVKSSGSSQSTISKKFNTVNSSRNSLNNSRSKNIYRQIKSNSKIVNLKSISTKVIFNKESATTTTLLQRSNYKHVLSNRAKQKSIQILRHKMSKNNQPCLLFQRFGFCAKFNEGTCPKVHDKKQVALCKNFLQGNCLLENCRLSHDVGPEKMPTCKYFLEGCCVRDSCQYSHVKVSANTPICIPFLQGYCEKGDKCKQRHTNICPEFEKTEKCSKGKNCPYPHKSSTSALNPKVYTKKKCKPKTTFNTQTGIDNDKSDACSSSNLLPTRDDTKKRYYDTDDCSDEILAAKRIRIITKINTMKSIMSCAEQNHQSVALDSSVVIDNNALQHSDKSSQPDTQNLQFKRQPIGPLPAYIPI